MKVSEDFSQRLKDLMAERQLSMSDLARLLHTQPSTLSRWFSGSVPQRNTLKTLAQVLRVNERWLASGEGSPSVKGSAVYSFADRSVLKDECLDPSSDESLTEVGALIGMLQDAVNKLAEEGVPRVSNIMMIRALVGALSNYIVPPSIPEKP